MLRTGLQAMASQATIEETEAQMLAALEMARHRQAKSLELMETIHLARLWQRMGKKEEAWHLLANIYGWLTEGFDTADLREAGALLAELLSSSLSREET